jgi:cobalt/nickel transport system permease protein
MSFSSIRQSIGNCQRRIPRNARLYYVMLGFWLATTAMHIPDGYLSPVTCAVMFAVMLPFWYFGLQKLREKINARSAPLIALLAAFSFVIMMFNVPLPGGTTGHAVGGALIAIILGPEVAVIAVSIALIIQAFFFGDGGILAIGANCFNMAVVLPFVSYGIYQAIAGKFPVDSVRRTVGAFVGGWIGLVVASFFAAVEFGIQPALFHTADGTPLYGPYPLSVAIPAMVIPHLLIAGVIEGLVTALVLVYLQRTNRELLEITANPTVAPAIAGVSRLRALWVGLAVLVFITPIGLLAPGTAWGEWGAEELTGLGLSFIPKGLEQLGSLWSAPLPDYEVAVVGNSNLGYIISAVIGIVVISIVTWLLVTVFAAGRSAGEGVPARKA